jgi:branched-subunit amino acid transport protein
MTLIALALVGLGSYGFRSVPLLTLPHRGVSPAVERGLRHAGTAAIAALVASALAGAHGGGDAVASLVAVGAALVVAARGATLLRVVTVGVVVYAALLVALHAVA